MFLHARDSGCAEGREFEGGFHGGEDCLTGGRGGAGWWWSGGAADERGVVGLNGEEEVGFVAWMRRSVDVASFICVFVWLMGR